MESLVLPDGEAHKTLTSFEQIMSALLEGNTDVIPLWLHWVVASLVIWLVLLLPVISVAFRLSRYQQLYSQVDSSVGGKTAVNHPLGKNMIGAFYQPKAVIIDIDCLRSLPQRELAAGMAEVIKYSIIGMKTFQLARTAYHQIFRHCSHMRYPGYFAVLRD